MRLPYLAQDLYLSLCRLCYNRLWLFTLQKEDHSVPDNPRLSHGDVRAIAELAKLALTDAEVALYTEQLSQILDYFTLLQEVDTSHIAATDSVLPLTNVLRDDTVSAALAPEQVVRNVPDAEGHQFKVRAVLGDE